MLAPFLALAAGPHPRGELTLTPRGRPRGVAAGAAPLIPADRRFTQVDVHLLDVQIFLDAPLAELAADAALLVAAPRRLDVGRLHVVHPHDPGAQILDDPHRAKDVARPHGRGEPVVRVVRNPQRLGFIVERDDAGNRTEDLLAGDARRVVD